ncbi:hypothetical protein DEDE109153_04005 [Deinococcus deserti]
MLEAPQTRPKPIKSAPKDPVQGKTAGPPPRKSGARPPGNSVKPGKATVQATPKPVRTGARQAPKASAVQGPQLPPGNASKPQLDLRPQRGSPPPAAKGIMGLFRDRLTELHKSAAGKRLTSVMDGARKTVVAAAKFARNPVKGVAEGASAIGRYAGGKVTQFKKWYATPEGKAKFWKGVALTAVGVATVATGGALTAPALALAAGISAGGGVAARVVENKVFNAAAAAKQKNDRKYQYKAKSTFEGVTARSVAIDAVVGSVGGPVFKFAGKALVGTAAALGKGALPAARGLAQLGAAAARGSGRATARLAARIVPRSVQKIFAQVGRLARKNVAQPILKGGRGLAAGARKVASRTSKGLRDTKNAAVRGLTTATAGPRAAMTAAQRKAVRFLVRETPNLRRIARQTPAAIREFVQTRVTAARRMDRRLLTRLKLQVRRSPTVKLARTFKNAVDTLGNRLSKNVLVRGKVALADGIDALKARVGQKVSQTSLARHARTSATKMSSHLDDIVARNPDGHFSKAILEFRTSGTAVRTHLNKVWGEASQGLNKDLSRLLGRHGSVQADFRNLAEQGNRALYEQEVAAARTLATDRLRRKIEQDTERALLAQRPVPGVQVNIEAVREQARQAGQNAVNQASDRLTREAETFVARHPSTVLEEAALKTQALEESAKAAEYYFGKNAAGKGLLERMGLALTAPARAPINERLERYTKIAQAMRSSTPLASTALIGVDTVNEALAKGIQTNLENQLKDKVSDLKGTGTEKKPKKATEEDGSVLANVLDETLKELFAPYSLEEIESDIAKKTNMKGGE